MAHSHAVVDNANGTPEQKQQQSSDFNEGPGNLSCVVKRKRKIIKSDTDEDDNLPLIAIKVSRLQMDASDSEIGSAAACHTSIPKRRKWCTARTVCQRVVNYPFSFQ